MMQEEKKAITCVETDGKQGKARVFLCVFGQFPFCFVLFFIVAFVESFFLS